MLRILPRIGSRFSSPVLGLVGDHVLLFSPQEDLEDFRDHLVSRRIVAVRGPETLYVDNRFRWAGVAWTENAFSSLCRRLGPGVHAVLVDTLENEGQEQAARLFNLLVRARYSVRLADVVVSQSTRLCVVDDTGRRKRVSGNGGPAWALDMAATRADTDIISCALYGAEAVVWLRRKSPFYSEDAQAFYEGWRWSWCAAGCHRPRIASAVMCSEWPAGLLPEEPRPWHGEEWPNAPIDKLLQSTIMVGGRPRMCISELGMDRWHAVLCRAGLSRRISDVVVAAALAESCTPFSRTISWRQMLRTLVTIGLRSHPRLHHIAWSIVTKAEEIYATDTGET